MDVRTSFPSSPSSAVAALSTTSAASTACEVHTLHLQLNGAPFAARLEAWTTLLDLLREHCGLTGTKKGCDHGQCGACTVLVDGRRVNACLTLAVMLEGATVQTIEGVAHGGPLHPLQRAFIDHDAFQCGYCTPGQICSAIGLLREGHAQSEDDVREQMSGNLCRCGAYPRIVSAVVEVLGHQQAAQWTAGKVGKVSL